MQTLRRLMLHEKEPHYLLRAEFSRDTAAPLPASLPIEVGGPLTVVDTENKLSIAGGALVCAGGKAVPGFGNPRIGDPTAIARRTGVALYLRLRTPAVNSVVVWGFDTDQGGSPASSRLSLNAYGFFEVINTSGLSKPPYDADYETLIVLRAVGQYAFIRAAGESIWQLIWMDNTLSETPLYPAWNSYNAATRIDDLRVVDLSLLDSRFTRSADTPTATLTGPAEGATAAHEADADIRASVTLDGVATRGLSYRRVDADNRWYLYITATGKMVLYEYVANVATERDSVPAGTLAAGVHGVQITALGAAHRVLVDDTELLSYTEAAPPAAPGTALRVDSAGWASVVCWPFNSYGLATARLATPAANATIAHTPDAWIEDTWTPQAGQTLDFDVRRTDADNRWVIRCDQGGSTVKLIERNAGVETERSSAAQTWTAGTAYRIVAILDGASIKTFVANVAKNSYATAAFNATATTAQVSLAGADLLSIPLRLALPRF